MRLLHAIDGDITSEAGHKYAVHYDGHEWVWVHHGYDGPGSIYPDGACKTIKEVFAEIREWEADSEVAA
jgi:hypothetical protein